MDEQFSYEGLYRLLEERRAKRPEGSYTTYLFEKGLDKILKKVGEECTEVIIAAKDRDHKETVYELADLAYHVLVLMVEAGISLDEVRAELAGRHVIDTVFTKLVASTKDSWVPVSSQVKPCPSKITSRSPFSR